MSGIDKTPDRRSHQPDELPPQVNLSEQEIWSLTLVENGLRFADLKPLASHLRAGYQIPPHLAVMIANALEETPDAVCKIIAKQSRGGRTNDQSKHARHVEIAMAANRRINGMKRGEYDSHISAVADEFGVSKTTVENALRHFSEQIRKWEKPVP